MKDARPAAVRNSNAADEASADFERECVDFFIELAQVLSLPRSLGQIYGLLFASPSPLSFTDIVERLEISKGSASQGLQLLRSFGAVRSMRDTDLPGASKGTGDDRRERFVPELSLRRLMGGMLREKIEPLLNNGNVRMRRLREYARQAPSPASAKFCLQKVKQLEEWRGQMGLLLPLLKTLFGAGRL
jgi:DNA-binding transcriptional regulator GbsR (MarR family)